jgi:hypothetical protein
MKCNAQQPLLASRHDQRSNVQKWRREELPVFQHANAACLLDDEQAIQPTRCIGCIDGALEAGRDQREFE